jgi:hypothetical protein
VATSYTAEQLEMLRRQVAHFASADHVREEISLWHDATPTEKLAELQRMCEVADAFLARLTPERLERALVRDPVSPESAALLAALRAAR